MVNDCWIWLGYIDSCGYGRIGGNEYAHRASYEHYNGKIQSGLTIDHLCRNRACVNPKHLEAVTLAENKRRGNSPSALNARKTKCPLGHPLVGGNARIYEGKRRCRICNNEWHRLYYWRRKAQ